MVPGSRSEWASSLGPILVIGGGPHRDASVIFPMFSDSTLTDTTTFETSRLTGTALDLFSRAGPAGRGTFRSATRRPRTDGCVAWPEGTVETVNAASDSAWTVAFEAGQASGIVLDSIESLSRADSAKLTVEVAHLASTLPSDTAVAFRGIPFFVRQIRRFTLTGDTTIVIANLTRRINQEANPREEQLFLIAERSGSHPDAVFRPVYHERVSGNEESIESSDVLAAVAMDGGKTPALVLIRDYGDGSAFALLTRTGPATWFLRWSSAYTGC